ncbi:MAG: outer membrane protein assembly factor BamB family protein [Anaerolineae bacterium]
MGVTTHKSLILIIVLVLLAGPIGCAVVNQYVGMNPLRVHDANERLFLEAERLMAANNKAEAILAYRQIYNADPSYEPALRQLAGAYADQGRRRLAAHFLQQLVTLNPADTDASRALADLLTSDGDTVDVQTLWQIFIEEQAISGIVLGEDTLYASTQGGTLAAVSTLDGSIRWQHTLNQPILGSPSYSADPNQPLVIVGCEDKILYALAADDGAQVWRFETFAPIYGAVTTSDGIVYAGSVDGTLYAIKRDDGALLWEFLTAGALHASPLVADGIVYIGSFDRTLYALNAKNGTLIWRFDANAAVETIPVIQGDLLFFGANNSRLYCLDRLTGLVIWRYSTGDAIYASAVVGEQVVYVASTRQALLAIQMDTGKLLWRFDTATYLTMRPEYDSLEGRLYLAANADPLLYCVDSVSGKLLWQFDTGDWLSTGPILSQRTLYLGGRDGTVSAYRLK